MKKRKIRNVKTQAETINKAIQHPHALRLEIVPANQIREAETNGITTGWNAAILLYSRYEEKVIDVLCEVNNHMAHIQGVVTAWQILGGEFPPSILEDMASELGQLLQIADISNREFEKIIGQKPMVLLPGIDMRDALLNYIHGNDSTGEKLIEACSNKKVVSKRSDALKKLKETGRTHPKSMNDYESIAAMESQGMTAAAAIKLRATQIGEKESTVKKRYQRMKKRLK